MKRINYHGVFLFPVRPAELWPVMERFDLYESWWRWLTGFRSDEPGLTEGNVLDAVIAPPAPDRLRLRVRLQRCDRPRLIEAVVEGDVSGPAALRLHDTGNGTRAEVTWSLALQNPRLRAAARVAYPLMRSGHDRLVETAVGRFRSRALVLAHPSQNQPSQA